MTKGKHTNRNSLWASGLSLVLCLAMLIGTTFAWFSDTVSNKGNRIQAGNLAVSFLASEQEENGDLKGTIKDLGNTAVKLFDLSNWAPGDTTTRYIKVKNTGSLALKYDVDFVVSGENNALADAIKIDVSKVTDSANVANGDATGATAEEIIMNGVLNNTNDFQIFKIDLTFMQSAGNTYNDATADFGLDVILNATQVNANATIVKARSIADINAQADSTSNPTIVLMKDINEPTVDVQLNQLMNIDTNGYTLTCKNFKVDSNSVGTMDLAGTFDIKGDCTINATTASLAQSGKLVISNKLTVNVASNTFTVNGTIEAPTVEVQGISKVVVSQGAVLKTNAIVDTTNSEEKAIQVQTGGTIASATPDTAIDVSGKDDIDISDVVDFEGAPEVPDTSIKITSVLELTNALKNQKDGQTWVIYNNGADYKLTAPAGVTAEGQGSWLMPITANNLTIKGVGNPKICASYKDPSSGIWSTQQVVAVLGENATFTGITLGGNEQYNNKVIEVTAKDFTISNCTIVDSSLYFNGNKGTVLVENNVFTDTTCGICFDSMDTATSVQINKNKFSIATGGAYAIGNQTWSNPATLHMADVYVNGNTFNTGSGVAILRNRMMGTFYLDANNKFGSMDLTAASLSKKIDSTPHAGLTAEQVAQRVVAIVSDNGKAVTPVSYSDLKSGSNGLSGDTINNFGYLEFKMSRDVDFSKAFASIGHKYNTNGGEWSQVYTYRSTTWGSGVLSYYPKGESFHYAYPKGYDKDTDTLKYANVAPANQVINTNETKVKSRFPVLFNAINATKNTNDKINVASVVTVADENGAIVVLQFPTVEFSNGTVTTPGCPTPIK